MPLREAAQSRSLALPAPRTGERFGTRLAQRGGGGARVATRRARARARVGVRSGTMSVSWAGAVRTSRARLRSKKPRARSAGFVAVAARRGRCPCPVPLPPHAWHARRAAHDTHTSTESMPVHASSWNATPSPPPSAAASASAPSRTSAPLTVARVMRRRVQSSSKRSAYLRWSGVGVGERDEWSDQGIHSPPSAYLAVHRLVRGQGGRSIRGKGGGVE